MDAHTDTATTDAGGSTTWTIGRLLTWTTDHFRRHDVADARLSAEVLLARASDRRRIDLYANFDATLNGEFIARFRDWVRRATTGEPIAYLVGEREFFSLAFTVTPAVLIPRPETEVLVECVIDHCAAAHWQSPRLLDLGTGSGCIAVTLLKQLPGATAVATDVSREALDVAASNAKRHGVTDRINLMEADRLALPAGAAPADGFDVIVSNPPYVPAGSLDKLHPTVRDFEPHLALSDGAEGLSFYQCLAAEATPLLRDSGVVFVEIDEGQTKPVIETVEAHGSLVHRRTWRDRVAGHERVLMFARGEVSTESGTG